MFVIDLTILEEGDVKYTQRKRERSSSTYVVVPKKMKQEEEQDFVQDEALVNDLIHALAAQMAPAHHEDEQPAPEEMTTGVCMDWVLQLYTPDLEIGPNEGGDVFLHDRERIMNDVNTLACW